jgi:molybdate transport system regulatory protein
VQGESISAASIGSRPKKSSRKTRNLNDFGGDTRFVRKSHYITSVYFRGDDPMENKRGIEGLTPNWKLWFEFKDEYVFGFGAYKILKSIQREGTITKGAESLGMSYRYCWGLIKKIEKKLDTKLLETYKGGTVGGGGARVTEEGLTLMEMFENLSEAFTTIAESTIEHQS